VVVNARLANKVTLHTLPKATKIGKQRKMSFLLTKQFWPMHSWLDALMHYDRTVCKINIQHYTVTSADYLSLKSKLLSLQLQVIASNLVCIKIQKK
jgi:hypothetical protein